MILKSIFAEFKKPLKNMVAYCSIALLKNKFVTAVYYR
jgi:hypothetical protein